MVSGNRPIFKGFHQKSQIFEGFRYPWTAPSYFRGSVRTLQKTSGVVLPGWPGSVTPPFTSWICTSIVGAAHNSDQNPGFGFGKFFSIWIRLIEFVRSKVNLKDHLLFVLNDFILWLIQHCKFRHLMTMTVTLKEILCENNTQYCGIQNYVCVSVGWFFIELVWWLKIKTFFLFWVTNYNFTSVWSLETISLPLHSSKV